MERKVKENKAFSSASKTNNKILLIDKEKFDTHFRKDDKKNFVNFDIDIFNELNNMSDVGFFKVNKNKIFTFGYIWLVSYLWKYSKYGENKYDVGTIKSILGSSAEDKRLDYLVKRNGVLDKQGYTEPSRDFPITTSFEGDVVVITTVNDIGENEKKDYLKNYGNRYFCKKPLKQYGRNGKPGLMFSRDDTFSLTVSEFTRTVLCREIGVDGFYLYAYIKLKLKITNSSKVLIWFTELKEVTGFCDKTIRKYINSLQAAGMISKETVVGKSIDGHIKTSYYSIPLEIDQSKENIKKCVSKKDEILSKVDENDENSNFLLNLEWN